MDQLRKRMKIAFMSAKILVLDTSSGKYNLIAFKGTFVTGDDQSLQCLKLFNKKYKDYWTTEVA